MAEPRQTFFANIDVIVFCLYLALVAVGGIFIYSVDVQQSGAPTGIADFLINTQAGKQVIWIIICLLVFGFIVLIIDHKFWQVFAYLIYGVGVAALILVLFLGTTIKGATSWFTFGGFSFQPSEVAKVGTCLAVAAFLSHWNTDLRNWRSALYTIALFMAPAALIMLQPDAGSALVFLSFFLVLFREGLSPWLYIIGIISATTLIVGILVEPLTVMVALGWIGAFIYVLYERHQRWRWLVGAGIVAAALWYAIQLDYTVYALLAVILLFAGLTFWQYLQGRSQIIPLMLAGFLLTSGLAAASNYAFNNILQPHQQTRINVWLRPAEAKKQNKDAVFNLEQSKLTIGAGGLMGQGLLSGRMTRGRWVPEQNTDFIFCAIGEQQGFLGSALVVLLFFALILRITYIAERQRTVFARVYAYGVAGILFIHIIVNIGMTMGLVPIIGIPLPFVSKGGSSLLGFTILLAILLKLDKHRSRQKLRNLSPF